MSLDQFPRPQEPSPENHKPNPGLPYDYPFDKPDTSPSRANSIKRHLADAYIALAGAALRQLFKGSSLPYK